MRHTIMIKIVPTDLRYPLVIGSNTSWCEEANVTFRLMLIPLNLNSHAMARGDA